MKELILSSFENILSYFSLDKYRSTGKVRDNLSV